MKQRAEAHRSLPFSSDASAQTSAEVFEYPDTLFTDSMDRAGGLVDRYCMDFCVADACN